VIDAASKARMRCIEFSLQPRKETQAAGEMRHFGDVTPPEPRLLTRLSAAGIGYKHPIQPRALAAADPHPAPMHIESWFDEKIPPKRHNKK
jgi:hypothetical protein